MKNRSQEYQELLDEFAGFVTNTWTQIRWDLMDRTTRVKNTEQALWLFIMELIAQVEARSEGRRTTPRTRRSFPGLQPPVSEN